MSQNALESNEEEGKSYRIFSIDPRLRNVPPKYRKIPVRAQHSAQHTFFVCFDVGHANEKLLGRIVTIRLLEPSLSELEPLS